MIVELVGGPFCGNQPDAVKDAAWILLDDDCREHKYARSDRRSASGLPIYFHDTVRTPKAGWR